MTPDNKMIQHLVNMAALNVKEHDQLMPVFFVGSDDKKEIAVIGAHFGTVEEKDKAAEAVKHIAELTQADFVLFIAESYAIKDQAAAKEYMSNMGYYRNSMSNHPMAVEIVMFKLETKNRCWTAIADILPGRELGKADWQETPGMEGRFSNLLGNKKPTIN